MKNADHLHREEPFAMLLPADQLFKDYQNQEMRFLFMGSLMVI